MPLPIFDEPWRKGGVGLLPYQVDIPAPQAPVPLPPLAPPVAKPLPVPGDGGSGGGGDDNGASYGTVPGSGSEWSYGDGDQNLPPGLFESFPELKGMLAGFAPFKTSPEMTSSAATTGRYASGGGLNAGYRPGDVQRYDLPPLPDTPGETFNSLPSGWDPDVRREQFGDQTGRDYFNPLFQREAEQQQEQQRQYLTGLFAQEAANIPMQRQAATDALINGALGLAMQDVKAAEGGAGGAGAGGDWRQTEGLGDTGGFQMVDDYGGGGGGGGGWYLDPETETYYR